MRVYGEFAQWLRPQVEFGMLGRVEAQVKKDAEQAYLAAASKPHLAPQLDVIREALCEFSKLYPRGAREAAENGRIWREQEARWTLGGRR